MNKSRKMPMSLDELKPYILLVDPLDTYCHGYLNLFHYTSSYAKKQIIRKDEIDFRFSTLSDFLDKNEGIHIFEPFHHALGTLYNNGEIDVNIYKKLKSIKISDIHNDTDNQWILCFSENGNSKFLKEKYAPKDGYIIGIRCDILEEIRPQDATCRLYKVEYSYELIYNKLMDIIKKLYNSYNYELNPHNQKSLMCDFKQIVTSFLSINSFIYKSSYYEKEQEVRMIFRPKESFSNWISKNKKYALYYEEKYKKKKCLHLTISHEALFCCNHNPSPCLDFRLNKGFITSDEIRNVYAEQQSS